MPALPKDLEVVGSDVDSFECPHCGCHDRERHFCMYFDRLDLWDRVTDRDVLHIAPEERLPERIAEAGPSSYIKGDLHPRSTEVQKVDITQIEFSDSSFDLIICNHVLEHVQDDKRAIAEFFRVLKSGGIAILQTPYSAILRNSFCDIGVDTDKLRRRLYGQEDHVRIYGRDLFERIESVGFEIQRESHADALDAFSPVVYGVNPREDLVICRRP
jgi:SAM-dependent methyltransferase